MHFSKQKTQKLNWQAHRESRNNEHNKYFCQGGSFCG